MSESEMGWVVVEGKDFFRSGCQPMPTMRIGFNEKDKIIFDEFSRR